VNVTDPVGVPAPVPDTVARSVTDDPSASGAPVIGMPPSKTPVSVTVDARATVNVKVWVAAVPTPLAAFKQSV
jgi:hypothetical protein